MVKSQFQKSYRSISGRKKYRAKSNRYRPIFFLLRLARGRIRAVILSVFLISVGGGVFYFALISSYFEIKEVNISGLRTISGELVRGEVNRILEQKKIGFLQRDNYFLFPADKVAASIQGAFPKIGDIKIEKLYPEILNISLVERDALGVWCKGEACFYFDKEGVIFEESPKSSGTLLISIEDMRDIAPNLGSVVLGEREITLSHETQRLVRGNFLFAVSRILIRADEEYELLTTEGWRVLLNKSDGLEYQLSNLKYVLDEKIKARRNELDYVDLRLGNRVYYKYK